MFTWILYIEPVINVSERKNKIPGAFNNNNSAGVVPSRINIIALSFS